MIHQSRFKSSSNLWGLERIISRESNIKEKDPIFIRRSYKQKDKLFKLSPKSNPTPTHNNNSTTVNKHGTEIQGYQKGRGWWRPSGRGCRPWVRPSSRWEGSRWTPSSPFGSSSRSMRPTSPMAMAGLLHRRRSSSKKKKTWTSISLSRSQFSVRANHSISARIRNVSFGFGFFFYL